MANSNATGIRIGIIAAAAIAAFLVAKLLFPQIIEQIAAGIVALGAFLVGLIFRRKRGA